MSVVIENQRHEIRYPHSPLMEKVIRDALGGEYPCLPFFREDDGIILDIGANIGCTSILFATYYHRAKVLSFEPATENFALLVANTQNFANVRPFRFGLLDRDGRGKLFHGHTIGATHSLGRSVLNTENHEEITLRRISTFLAEQNVERIMLLKIDTEGAEVPILRDLEPLLDRVGAISLEYHSERDRREIDHLLGERFVLYKGIAQHVHRGVLTYVAKGVIAARTDLGRWEISRPVIG